ncbi:unnamed protein product, partial [Cuscuta epithymum]
MSKLPPSGRGPTKRKRPATPVARFVSRVPSSSIPSFGSSSTTPPSSTPPSSTPSLGSSPTIPQVGSSSTSPPCDLSQSTPSPNTATHVSTDTPISNNNSEQPLHVIGSIGPNGRLCIGVKNKQLLPSEECSRKITSLFKERVDPHGYSWANLSEDIIKFYWDEFKKHCYWNPIMESSIKAAWTTKAKQRYSNYLSNMKTGRCQRNSSITQEVWDSWMTMWSSEEFQKKSNQSKKNRRQGELEKTALSTHTSGAISHAKVASQIEKDSETTVTSYQVFLYTHTKNHDGETFVNDQAKEVNDEFVLRREELIDIGEEVDDDELFYDVVGGPDSKNRLYGTGSYGTQNIHRKASEYSSEMDTSSPQCSSAEIDHLKVEVERLQKNVAQQKEFQQQAEQKQQKTDDVIRA